MKPSLSVLLCPPSLYSHPPFSDIFLAFHAPRCASLAVPASFYLPLLCCHLFVFLSLSLLPYYLFPSVCLIMSSLPLCPSVFLHLSSFFINTNTRTIQLASLCLSSVYVWLLQLISTAALNHPQNRVTMQSKMYFLFLLQHRPSHSFHSSSLSSQAEINDFSTVKRQHTHTNTLLHPLLFLVCKKWVSRMFDVPHTFTHRDTYTAAY